jgi:transcriptional regulator of acetoin/glycerol metabolism
MHVTPGSPNDALSALSAGGTVDESSHGTSAERVVSAPHLFLVLEGARPVAGGARHSLANVDEILLRRGSARRASRRVEHGTRTLVLDVPDARMSATHARITRKGSAFAIEDLGSTNGTRVGGAPLVGTERLESGDVIEAGHTVFLFRADVRTRVDAPGDLDASELADVPRGFATLDPDEAARLAELRKVARSRVPVVLLGETGTGKEVVARALHELSGRSGAFVAVNCGGLTETLAESQLFGHVRGAFTGAVRDETGFVRASDGGTLFLDEIAELPRASQAALLRVLQEGEVVPVGTTLACKVDLRIIVATHRDLDQMITRGEFRRDLFARVAGVVHELPPLRDRVEDLGLLLASIWPLVVPDAKRKARISPEAVRALLDHAWPHNVRELVRCIELASVVATDTLEVAHLPASIDGAGKRAAEGARKTTASARPTDDHDPDDLQRRLIDALGRHQGNVSDVARELGKARMQVQRWMKRFNIDPKSFRDA